MAAKIFDHKIAPPPPKDALHPQLISPDAARGGPLGGHLLAMMAVAIVLVVVASVIINYLY